MVGVADRVFFCLSPCAGILPLTWPQRVQIALDAARGLEYIHEHTKPTYIHRDIKCANILIDDNFRAKVRQELFPSLSEGFYLHDVVDGDYIHM